MTDIDVVQVGYGPVSQVLAALLGARGHRVQVLERHTDLYAVSRAGTLDHEFLRILQGVGVAAALEPLLARNPAMTLTAADGSVLASLPMARGSVSGWHSSYTMYQPDLEAALDARVRSLPGVEVLTGWEVDRVEDAGDHVRVESRQCDTGERRVSLARYVIGADGANSVVREQAGLATDDLGYRGPWLVCDFRHHDPQVALPFQAGFVLDPARPALIGRWLGRAHSRMEFMLKPGEDPEQFDRPERCWELARERGVTPETSTIERHAVYKFGSLLARDWRRGRVLLAGDAAHVMPPFLGQGLCSGARDAANLAWKLDLVLRDEADDALLDTYAEERRAHVEQVTHMSMGLGMMVSITDAQQAAGRDAALRTPGAAAVPPMPGLTGGILHRDADGSLAPGVGQLALQAQVELDGRRDRLDDVVGGGWRILTRRPVGTGTLTDTRAEVLERLDARIVAISPAPAAGWAVDVDLDYEAWFDRLGADAVIVRPDFHVFAAVGSVVDLGDAIDDLAAHLVLR